jgi:hypothetical protein
MKEFTYQPDTLPLCPERKPFEYVSEELCAQIAREALAVPERRGRLTDIVREIVGQEIDEPAAYMTIESHIGLTTVDQELTTGLFALGFEPHSFAGEQPTGYHHNFTQQFVLHRPNTDRPRLRILLRNRTEEARKLVQDNPRTIGFIESELYQCEYNSNPPVRTLAPEALDHFPRKALTYRQVTVPTTETEEAASGIPLDSRRAADVHVKIPGHFTLNSTKPLAEQIDMHEQSRNPLERSLGDCLCAVGFYQQISQSGNFLYTAHYGELKEANRAFSELARFASEYGGMVNVVREACTGLWRKATITRSGETRLASIPPLLISDQR